MDSPFDRNIRAQVAPNTPSLPLLVIGMAPTAVYATQVSAGEYLLPRDFAHRDVLPPASPTLVNAPRYTERSSVKLKIPNGSSNIVNSVVVDAVGRSLFSISSNSKRTMLVSCTNDVKVATIEWDRSSPRIVFGGKKMKCKDWLPRAGPETEYVSIPATAYRF